MKLYTFPPAPSPQRVHMFLKEKGIEIPFEQVDMMKQEQLSDTYKSVNPRGTLPALVLDDGTVISEVVAICRYLDATYAENPLHGADPTQQALVTEWDHRIEMECMMGIAEALRNKGDAFKNRALPGPLDIEQIGELVPRGLKRIAAFFEVLDEQLATHQFVAGNSFSVADITAFVAVNFASWVKMSVPDELTHLKRWHAEVGKRPSTQA